MTLSTPLTAYAIGLALLMAAAAAIATIGYRWVHTQGGRNGS